MKKEVFVAIVLGLGLGLFITYGMYRARTALIPETNIAQLSSPEPSGMQLASSLVITSPEDETVVTTKDLTIAGTTEPNTFVVVLVGDADTITTADETGNFSVKGELKEGSNTISVYSIDEQGSSTQEQRTVILGTGVYAMDPQQASSPSATPAAKQ